MSKEKHEQLEHKVIAEMSFPFGFGQKIDALLKEIDENPDNKIISHSYVVVPLPDEKGHHNCNRNGFNYHIFSVLYKTKQE